MNTGDVVGGTGASEAGQRQVGSEAGQWQVGDARRRQLVDRHLKTLAALFDAMTFHRIDMLGITGGWRCWEVGAGVPTVPTWLARRVGAEGYVLATDVEVSLLQSTREAAFEVRQHNIGIEPVPTGGFDLVHARLVLEHVPGRGRALATMVEALGSGGWLLVESADPLLLPLACPEETGPAQRLANKLRQASWTLYAQRIDLAFGRTLPRLLRRAGLDDVAADAFFPLASPMVTQLQQTMIESNREPLIAAGLATAEEIEQHLADVGAGELDLVSFPLISAWGRKNARALEVEAGGGSEQEDEAVPWR